MTNEELNSVMEKAKKQFRKGEPLFGKNGAFHFMLENFLNTALETEMDEHLAENKGNHGPCIVHNPVLAQPQSRRCLPNRLA
jgi:hypothetical protein